jgi:hypothetical protein
MDIIKYIHSCIRPKNETEFVESSLFQRKLYDNLIQDGFYICKDISDEDKNILTDYVKIGEYYIIRKIIRELAWLNNNGSFEWDLNNDGIYRRLLPPPIETVNHTKIISTVMDHILSSVSKPIYIEYGIRWCENFKILSEINKNGINIGVDIVITYMNKYKSILDEQNIDYRIYEMLTDDFSDKHLPNLKPHLVFIDADHSSVSAIKDFENVLTYLEKNGYIILHDTYPCFPEYLNVNITHDCYKVPLYIKEKYIKNQVDNIKLEMLTLPLNPGVTIIHKLT